MKKIDRALADQLKTIINSMGYELVGSEVVTLGRQKLFRIYIDNDHGVTADGCSQVSRQISAMMDVADPIQGPYTLEVSSPGIDRPLFEIEHYKKFIGSRVKIRLYSPINQRKQFKGIIERVEAEDIYLLVDDTSEEIVIPFAEIDKANLVVDIRL